MNSNSDAEKKCYFCEYEHIRKSSEKKMARCLYLSDMWAIYD